MINMPIMAEKVADLYQAAVKVSDRSQKNMQIGVDTALAQVFVKVSGNNQVATIPQVNESLSHASTFVESFAYKSSHSNLYLTVKFNRRQVDKVLREARQSLWDENRPKTLLWFSRQIDGKKPVLINSVQYPTLSRVIKRDAARRGIPILLPKSATSLTVQEVWQLNKGALARASEEFDADEVLGLRVEKNIDDEWFADCLLILHGQTISWRLQALSEESLISSVVDRLADELAAQVLALRYHASQERISLEISGITSLESYTSAIDYVKHLIPVSNVEIVGVKSDVLTLDVLAGGGVTGLVEALERSKHRKLDAEPEYENQYRGSLRYRWRTVG